jgi:DNA-binding NarL/FixJ family response regulator
MIAQARPIRVGIIDGQTPQAKGLSLLINGTAGLQVAHTYASAKEALGGLNKDLPDVLLFLLGQTQTEELAHIRAIRKLLPLVKILVVSEREDEELVFHLLRAGAGGFLTRDVSPLKLLEAIREIQDGGAPMSMNVARLVVASFFKNNDTLLTPRELEVLGWMARGKSYSQIANMLYVDKETVRSHIKNIYTKLEVHSKADAIEKATQEKLI